MAEHGWAQGPSNALGTSVDFDALRIRLQQMTDDELVTFGKQMQSLVYAVSYGADGKPVESAFSIQLREACAEWRRRQFEAEKHRPFGD